MATLRVKNWKSFQHYKQRNPPWIKLHKGLLDDYEFHCLPLASRALAPMLWLLASEHADGLIDRSYCELAFRLRITEPELIEALTPLTASGFIECLQDASGVQAERKHDATTETEKRQSTETEGEEKPIYETTLSSPSPSYFNAAEMARMVCDSLGYFGLDAMRTAEQVVEAAMKQNNQNAEAAGHWIIARWNAFKSSPAGQDKWSTPKHFLTQRVFEPEVRWMGDTRLQAEAALGTRREEGDDEAQCAKDCGMTVEEFREWKAQQRRKA